MKKIVPLIATILIACFSLQYKISAQEQIAPPSYDSGRANRQRLMQKYFLEELTISITAPTSWMNETRDNHGCRWKWRAQYFCGGVAHEPSDDQHHGWEEIFQRPWNQWVNPDSIPGMWGRIHIQETLDSGYLQWITTYNISQSYPAHYNPGPAEAVKINIKE